MALQERIVSFLGEAPADQYSLYKKLGASMSEVTRGLAELQERKAIHITRYRKNRRTGLDIPVYSLSEDRNGRIDLHGLLAGVTSERLVEYDFVARQLTSRRRNSCVLDVGAAGSGLAGSIKQHRKGWRTYGMDIKDGSDCIMDARLMGFRNGVFDHVLSISTIEHISDLGDVGGDQLAMLEIRRIMKKGGTAIITVPYGRAGGKGYRVYDRSSLAMLVRPFVVAKKEFYMHIKGKWRRCSQQSADRARHQVPLKHHSTACACLLLTKPRSP